MLRIESRNGRVFAVDLAEVVAVTFATGMLTAHLPHGVTLSIGGDSWGGNLSLIEANQIIDMWIDARNETDTEIDEWEKESSIIPQEQRTEAKLDLTPVQPVAPRKRRGHTWKEAKRKARSRN